jgi:hypothetical protein
MSKEQATERATIFKDNLHRMMEREKYSPEDVARVLGLDRKGRAWLERAYVKGLVRPNEKTKKWLLPLAKLFRLKDERHFWIEKQLAISQMNMVVRLREILETCYAKKTPVGQDLIKRISTQMGRWEREVMMIREEPAIADVLAEVNVKPVPRPEPKKLAPAPQVEVLPPKQPDIFDSDRKEFLEEAMEKINNRARSGVYGSTILLDKYGEDGLRILIQQSLTAVDKAMTFEEALKTLILPFLSASLKAK